MADDRVIYLGRGSAIEANALEGFSPFEIDELLAAVAGRPRLAQKIRRARDWRPADPGDELEERLDVRALAVEALSEPTLGPASDRDAAQYWANLARSLARAVSAAQEAEDGR